MPTPFAVHYYISTAGTPRIEVRPVEDVPDEYAGDDEQFCPEVRATIEEYRTRIEHERDPDEDTHGDFGGERVAYLGFHSPEEVAVFAYRNDQPDPRLDGAVARYDPYEQIDGIGLATRLEMSLVEVGALIEADPRFACAGSPWTPWVDREVATEATSSPPLSTAPRARERDETRAETNGDDSERFDPLLRAELERGTFNTREDALTGEIRGTGAWTPGADIPLRVWVPFEGEASDRNDTDDSARSEDRDERGETFVEDLSVPAPDQPLSVSKFGRLLAAHGYDRDSAEYLVGEEVACIYRGAWEVVDPEGGADVAGGADGGATDDPVSATSRTPPLLARVGPRGPHEGATRLGVLPVALAIAAGGVLSLAADTVGLPEPVLPGALFGPIVALGASLLVVLVVGLAVFAGFRFVTPPR